MNFEELKSELDMAKKEIQTEQQMPPQQHQRNQRQTLLVSQHKDVNPMVTESSNESLRDLSAGPHHHFDISPLEGEDGEISRITQLVSAKRSYENSAKGSTPQSKHQHATLEHLRKRRDEVREQARQLSENLTKEEKIVQQELAKLN